MNCFFESDRLALRSWTHEDKTELRTINSAPAVMEYFTGILISEESDMLADKIKNGYYGEEMAYTG
ncbi:hypothetical protein [Methanolobus halotolerans]|uniref:Acetyltransferase (GNAT) domain-containing protein n=1 Tax=Methanolobus halotolerans TaxID=2052935 RepID=A0A4E0PVE2_9EURY|nr:hypothetical protein [Methanolobus halotolerans]TGC09109.1 hypothetical protein CUN85_06975 [Methanolobus halotolerans]